MVEPTAHVRNSEMGDEIPAATVEKPGAGIALLLSGGGGQGRTPSLALRFPSDAGDASALAQVEAKVRTWLYQSRQVWSLPQHISG